MSRSRLLLSAGGGFLGAYLLDILARSFEVHAGSRPPLPSIWLRLRRDLAVAGDFCQNITGEGRKAEGRGNKGLRVF